MNYSKKNIEIPNPITDKSTATLVFQPRAPPVPDPACVNVVSDDLGPPVFVLVDKAPLVKVFVEVQAVVNDSFAAIALAAKKLLYNAFQADIEVRILEGIGATVACALEQLELSIEAAAMYRGSDMLNAWTHQ
jgi:hypothetical protein